MQKEAYENISTSQNDPIMEWRTCEISGDEFPIYQGDIDLLTKLYPTIGSATFDLPLPTLAPRVRELMSLMYKNERNLYHITSSLSSESTVSRIAPEMGVPVYTMKERAGDGWDPLEYGIEWRPGDDVLQILKKLSQTVPYQDMVGSFSNLENSAQYTNYTADLKNCYLLFDANRTQESAYCTKSRQSSHVFDCLNVQHCEYCYECVDCVQMYACQWCYDCDGCRDSAYLIDCHGCDHCIGCVNLVNASYYIYNQQVSKEEYLEVLTSLKQNGWKLDQEKREILQSQMIKKPLHLLNTESSLGENIKNSKNVFLSRAILEGNELRYCFDMGDAQDCMDVACYGHASNQMYASSQVGRYSSNIYFCSTVGKGEHLYYCLDTKKSKHCFGCVNLKHKQYCIFNIQYTKEEYELLVPQIIQQMKVVGQRGYFPGSEMVTCPYNDSVAMDIYPPAHVIGLNSKTLEENKKGRGVVRLLADDAFIVNAEFDLGGGKIIPLKRRTSDREINIPSDATVVDWKDSSYQLLQDSFILKAVFICTITGRPYRIIGSELKYYRDYGLPLPKVHPTKRFRRRFALRPGKLLYLRDCERTGETILSVYPEGVSGVVNEKVYAQEMRK